jgi:hypothetical protein
LEIAGLAVLQSGLPFTVTVPGVDPIPANQSINLWFDPAAFTVRRFHLGNAWKKHAECARIDEPELLDG